MLDELEPSEEPRKFRRGDDGLEAGAANPSDGEDDLEDEDDLDDDEMDDDEDDLDDDLDDDLIDLDDEFDDPEGDRERQHPPHAPRRKYDD